MAVTLRHDISGHPLLTAKAVGAVSEVLEQHNLVAEVLLGLHAIGLGGTAGNIALAAVATQVSYQIAQGLEPAFLLAQSEAKRATQYRRGSTVHPRAWSLAQDALIASSHSIFTTVRSARINA